MGVKLDWEVESEAGWSEVGEDAAVLEARRKRNRQLRNLAATLIAIGLVIAGGIGWRLHQVGSQLRADLAITIDAETTALRTGNIEGFLAAQADLGTWKTFQKRTFNSYQELGQRVQVSGKITKMDITADQARVVIEETLDGDPYHVLWFYQHDERGWRHVPPSAAFWGDQATEKTLYFTFDYYQQDKPLVEVLKIRLNNWWGDACRAVSCTDYPPKPHVRIEPDPLAKLGWASYDSNTLIVPSPLLSRVPASGTYDPALYDSLADLIAKRWAEQTVKGHVSNPVRRTSDTAWAEDELATYLHHHFVGSAPASGFFDPLVTAYGESVITAFLDRLPNLESDQSILEAVQAIAGPEAVNQVDWSSYLGHRLHAEADLVARGFMTEAVLLYRDPNQQAQDGVIDVPTETLAISETIRVEALTHAGDVTWAEVHFKRANDPAAGEQVSYEPYRVVEGRWVHTIPQISDWGTEQAAYSPHIALHYYDLDAPWMNGLLPTLEQLYAQSAADFGIDPGSLQTVNVYISLGSGHLPGFAEVVDQGSSEDSVGFVVLSPYVTVRTATIQPGDDIRASAARNIVADLVHQRVSPLAINHPFAVAFMTWELERYGIPKMEILQRFLSEQGRLSEQWPAAGSGDLAFVPPYKDEDYTSARALIDVLVNRYSAQSIPLLMQNLPQSTDVNDWLNRSYGIMFEDVRADWEVAVRAAK